MQREIKFRAFQCYTGSEIFRTPINKFRYFTLTPNGGISNAVFLGEYKDWQQFTGLKDKNGVEIYEGDILKNANGDDNGVVSFFQGMFVVGKWGCELYKFSGDTKEVIGNIYEANK